MRILGICGSLRRGSHTCALLRAAAAGLPCGVRLELFGDLRAVPPYDEDYDVEPALDPVRVLRSAVAGADAVLFSTPEYNASIPGQLKNAVDWASRPFPESALYGKPVAVVGGSTGMFGAAWAQADLRRVLGTAGARVVDLELPVPAVHEAFDLDGRLRDRHRRDRLAEIVSGLIAEAGAGPMKVAA